MATRTDILTPVGRIIAGDIYKGSDKDAEGKPRTVKTGPNAGQATVQFYLMLAIPKGPEQHWAQTAWGQIIYAEGLKAFPTAAQSPAFAWKVKDGDSQIPNRKGRKPCDMEGARGHWLLSFTSGFAAKVYKDNGQTPLDQPGFVNPGDYVQVFGSVSGNNSQQQPGVFLNSAMVNFVAYGERIVQGPDATAVGFGVGVSLPPGASLTPPAGNFAPVAPGVPTMPAAPGVPAMPAAPGVPAMPAAPGMPGVPGVPGVPAMPAAPPTAVAPHPGFLAPAAVAAPAATARQMTAKANGYTYEQLIALGWTDAVLVQHGLMLA